MKLVFAETPQVVDGKYNVYIDGQEVSYFENFDLEHVVSPVNADKYEQLLLESNYDGEKTRYLVKGFREGFSIGYEGEKQVQQKSPNLVLHVGNQVELWNKVMKEVKEKRYAGPFKQVPFEHYIQSPIGLVPKDNGTKTRLIFHLSYPRRCAAGKPKSVNANTPAQLCKVKYCEFDQAIKRCLEEGTGCFIAKSDMSAAFRNLGIKLDHWPYLVMMAVNPVTGETCYFVDKCLPFGASISCAHFQAFSDSIAHIMKHKTGKQTINYLDDFLFAALLRWICDFQVQTFLDLCGEINFPVSIEKTFWVSTCLTFLGLLIDTVKQIVAIPQDKIQKGKELIHEIVNKRKVTIHKLQSLCGFLNFLGRSVVPGRAFTRRLYAAYSLGESHLKAHHHVRVSQEVKLDLNMWIQFLNHPAIFSRPFLDFSQIGADVLNFYTDAAKTEGFGGYCDGSWMFGTWDPYFITQANPSISFLELYAVTVAVIAWIHRFKNRRIILFCDNQGAVDMINSNTSSCKRCMVLIRILVLQGLIHNVKINA